MFGPLRTRFWGPGFIKLPVHPQGNARPLPPGACMGSVRSVRRAEVYVLIVRIEPQFHLAALHLTPHLGAFFLQRIVAVAVIRALAQHKRLYHACQSLRREL